MAPEANASKPSTVRTEFPTDWDRHPEFQRTASGFVLVGALGFLLVLFFVAPEQLATIRGAAPPAFALLASISLILLARGNARLAGLSMVFGTWLYVTVVAAFTGGLHANMVIVYPLIIVMVGWRLGPRAAFLLAGLTVAVSIGFYFAAATGVLPPTPPNPAALPLLIQVLVLAFSAVLVSALVRSHGERLGEVGKLGEDLAQRSAELQAREVDLNRAQSVARIGSWTYDIAADVFRSSAEACRIFGVPEGTRGKRNDFLGQVHPEDRAAVTQAWQVALAGGKPFRIEHRIVLGQEVRWVAQVAEFELDAAGRPVRGVGTTQDMTERKRLEQRLALTLDVTRVVPWELDLRTGRMSFDQALLPSLALEFDGVMETIEAWIARVHPDERDQFVARFQLATQPGDAIFDFEYRLHGKGGRYQWIHSKGTVIQRGKEGKPELAVGTSMNISARKRIDEAVRGSEERSRNLATLLRLMCDNVPDMIWAKDLDGRYLFANKATCEQLLNAADTEEPLAACRA